MKKLFLILTIALSLTAASCGETVAELPATDATDTVEVSDETVNVPAKVSETYTITLDSGLIFKLGDTYDYASANLGEPVDILEAPNCIREGNDTVYTYNGYSIMTSPDGNGGYFLADFTLLSDAVAFDNGITIGSTAADVDAAYGTDFLDSFGVRTYVLPGASVSIVFNDDTVSAITFSSTRD